MKQHSIVLIMLICTLVSCKNLYVQKSVFVPFLKEKGEVKVEASFGREGVTVNSAYAVTDHIGVMLNGFSAFENSERYDRKYNYNLEAGIGYHMNFLDSFHYETYIGFGQGILNSDYDRLRSDYNQSFIFFIIPYNFLAFFTTLMNNSYRVNGSGNYNTAFFQHTLGVSSEGNTFSLTGRAQYVRFDRYFESTTAGNQTYWYEVKSPAKLFIQPVLTDKIRIVDRLNLVLQIGANIDTDNKNEVFEWNKFFYYAGFEYTFNLLKKK